jgi:phosphatidate phosphatase LPIN
MRLQTGFLNASGTNPELLHGRPMSGDWSSFIRPHSDDILRQVARSRSASHDLGEAASDQDEDGLGMGEPSASPPPLGPADAIKRAQSLSQKLAEVNIPTQITETGDLMLDMSAFQNSNDALGAEVQARRVLSEELQGDYDIATLFGMDENGNLWIYASEEAKEAAMKKMMEPAIPGNPSIAIDDARSDPGYQSDDSTGTNSIIPSHRRSESDAGLAAQTPMSSPGSTAARSKQPSLNYAKTLRLTSQQLKALDLKPGENSMSFTVNRATCSAFMYLWKHETPVVISDIDGTITKSDALGHVLNMIGRDWTHLGVAKLYSDIATNGYNIMYLTSRSVGQADTTRAYLAGVQQDRYRLPRGPTILSPDRTMAALRREIYLRKPHVFKMSTLRDIKSLYGQEHHPFYAGFGNRLTDQISYRTVDVPRNRIFTINSNAQVSLDLLSLNKLRLSYVNMTEIVDHYFPPVSTLVKGGGEDYTDFKYWRNTPLEIDDFSASDSEEAAAEQESQYGDDDEEVGAMGDSYISRNSVDEYGEGSVLSGDYEDDDPRMLSSMIEEGDEEDADDENELEEEDEEALQQDQTEVMAIPETLPLPEAPKKSPSPQVLAEDVNAELITGIKDLTLSRESTEEGA